MGASREGGQVIGVPQWSEYLRCLRGVQVIMQQQERLAEGSQQWLPEDLTELFFEGLEVIQSVKHRLPTCSSEGDAFRSPIFRIGKPFDGAHTLEIVHQLAHGLPGNA